MRNLIQVLCVGVAMLAAPRLQAGFVPIYGGPSYDATTETGYVGINVGGLNDSGTALGYGRRYDNGVEAGYRAVRWQGSGPAVELDTLGASSGTVSLATAINAAGASVGIAAKVVGGSNQGLRPVRWDSTGTGVSELGVFNTNPQGAAGGSALAINAGGQVVGSVPKHIGGSTYGPFPVRWDPSGSGPIELQTLGTGPAGGSFGRAEAINDSGTVVGRSERSSSTGSRAVRWEANGITVMELDSLGVDSTGRTFSAAIGLNNAGTVVGHAWKHAANGDRIGTVPVRWLAESTAILELENLGVNASGATDTQVVTLNESGIAVGHSTKFIAGASAGQRAVTWDTASGAITELADLGTNPLGETASRASGLNDHGWVAGYADKYTEGVLVGRRAVLWMPDSTIIDLNDIIDPLSGWTLTNAGPVTNTGWIAGVGLFDPDGPSGPLAAYSRAFVLQIPEPASTVPFIVLLALLCRGCPVRTNP